MARKALIEKSNKTPKFAVRQKIVANYVVDHAVYFSLFMMCRLCFRKNALKVCFLVLKKQVGNLILKDMNVYMTYWKFFNNYSKWLMVSKPFVVSSLFKY